MSFGLANAPQIVQWFIDTVLHCFNLFCAYIDDLLTASNSLEKHYQHLEMVFLRLDEYCVVINPSKYRLGQAEINFLGHLIRKEGNRPLPSKIDVINGFLTLISRRKLKQNLALLNSYSRFFPHCDTIAFPLITISSADINKIALTTGQNEESVQPKRLQAKCASIAHPKPADKIHFKVNNSKFFIGWCPTISSWWIVSLRGILRGNSPASSKLLEAKSLM